MGRGFLSGQDQVNGGLGRLGSMIGIAQGEGRYFLGQEAGSGSRWVGMEQSF